MRNRVQGCECSRCLVCRPTLGILPPGAAKTITADTTATTSAAGLPKDLSSPREALSRELSAASAWAIMGSAASRSLEHSSWKAMTSA